MTVAPGKWTSVQVRKAFIDFFTEKQSHTFVPSSPVVPVNDPTLLFANAGMNQFKDIFRGMVTADSDFGKLKRAVNSQMVIRAGGKHNDLDDVGKDTYHHTFFEMLGNWSFGDFFKTEAIAWCFDLMVGVYGLDKSRLYATYFEGDAKLGLEPDNEARDEWLKYLPANQVLPGNAKDNFWEMGDVGPCGPCSELHYDRIGGRDAASLVNQDDPNVLELWNLVFMQFYKEGGKLSRLPANHVDTGMGLERILSVLNDVPSNYDTDLWFPMFDAIQKITKFPTSYQDAQDQNVIAAYRVVADHVRCITMAISDGGIPDNVGRGFVLRRIIRRAIRFGKQYLGAEVGFFTALVPTVVEVLGSHFTHLNAAGNLKRVTAITLDEEQAFDKTWKTGLKHYESAKESAVKANQKFINPKEVFVLHDRYGFPSDLTKILAEADNLDVNLEDFKKVLKEEQGEGGAKNKAEKTFLGTFEVDALTKAEVPRTENEFKYVWESISSKVLKIYNKKATEFVDTISTDAEQNIGLLLEKSNFYYESGGQVYDTGVITTSGGAQFKVEQCFDCGGYVAHIGRVVAGSVSIGDDVKLEVDYARRQPIAANHTATHMLNHALRDVLQYEKKDSFIEVNQKGSYLSDEFLRFDFSNNAKLSPDEIRAVEVKVADAVASDMKVYTKLVPLDDALSIPGIRCMFGEKYPDPCVVVSIGKSVEDCIADNKNDDCKKFAVELCGGTHIKGLSEIQDFAIVGEDALTKGVRRMTAFTREKAAQARALAAEFAQQQEAIIANKSLAGDEKKSQLGVLLKAIGEAEIPILSKLDLRASNEKAVKAVLAEIKAAEAELKVKGTALGKALAEDASVAGPTIVKQLTELGADNKALTAYVDAFSKGRPDSALFVFGLPKNPANPALAMCYVPKAFNAKDIKAPDWLKAACFGKGGGKPTNAQTGVPSDKVEEAIKNAETYAAENIVGKL